MLAIINTLLNLINLSQLRRPPRHVFQTDLFVQIRRMVGVAVAIAMGKVDPGLVDRSKKCIHTSNAMLIQWQFHISHPAWAGMFLVMKNVLQVEDLSCSHWHVSKPGCWIRANGILCVTLALQMDSTLHRFSQNFWWSFSFLSQVEYVPEALENATECFVEMLDMEKITRESDEDQLVDDGVVEDEDHMCQVQTSEGK